MIAFASAPLLAWKTGDKIAVNGGVALVWPSGSQTVLSVQPDGRYETRSKDAIGAWETATDKGDQLVYGGTGNIFVIPVIAL